MRKRILILDDDPDLLEILTVVFSEEGFEAITVEETDDLLSLIRKNQPALILLDFGLKSINGAAWCSKLKSIPEFARIPVIIFTAYSNKGLKKGSFGCDDFINKPFDLNDMVDRVKALIAFMPQSSINNYHKHTGMQSPLIS